MKEENNNRTQWLHVRLTEEEFKTVGKAYGQTAERTLSDFLRKMVLRKPLIGKVRNQSMDELMNELIALRKELNMAGHNFNQAIKKLNSLKDGREVQSWILTYDIDRKKLNAEIEKISSRFNAMAQSWLQ